MSPYTIVGFNKPATRFIRLEIEAESQGDAMRIARQLVPDAGALSVRAPKHAERILAFMENLPLVDRVAV